MAVVQFTGFETGDVSEDVILVGNNRAWETAENHERWQYLPEDDYPLTEAHGLIDWVREGF